MSKKVFSDLSTKATPVSADKILLGDSQDLTAGGEQKLKRSTFGAIIDEAKSGIIIDEDNMATDSATLAPSQQSTKAYVDTQVATKADSSHAHTASQITDFDTEVSNNVAVTTNTAKTTYPSADSTKVSYISVTQPVDLDQMETDIAALDSAVVLQGTWDASSGSFPGGGTAQAGYSYIVSVGGTVGSVAFVVNDRIVAITDNASNSAYASNRHKLDYTDQVLSVASKTGAVTLDHDDITDFDTELAGKINTTAFTPTADYHPSTKKYVDDEISGITQTFQIAVFGATTDVSTGDGKAYISIPATVGGFDLTSLHAEFITAGTTGTTDIQIYNVTQATDMLSTKLTIDSGETGSDTAATAAVIDTANDDVASYDVIRIDVDAVSTTAPQGLIITLQFS